MNLLASAKITTPNYFCTWSAQSFCDENNALVSSWPRNLALLTEDRVFGPEGWATVGIPQAARSSLYLLFDVGWDVEAEEYKEHGFGVLGRGILSEHKFPRLTKNGSASQAERLALANQEVKKLGWRGLALWISPQVPGVSDPTPEQIRAHFTQHLNWSREAGIEYWKVDCGHNMLSAPFRQVLTDLSRKIAPDLIMEHGRGMGSLNDESVPWDKLPGGRSGRFEKWMDSVGSVSATSTAIAAFADVFRTYDVTFNLSVATTLDRVGYFLANTQVEKPAAGILNVEDEVYIAAALGCSMGVMRHPSWSSGEGLNYDPYHLRRRVDEVTRAVRWQQIAPAFGISETSVAIDQAIGSDVCEFGPGVSWVDWMNGQTVHQGAPLRITRGCELPVVIPANGNQVPFVVASRNPNGAVSIATLPRTLPELGTSIPAADIRIKIAGDPFSTPVGIFGLYQSLTLEFDQPISIQTKAFAQDLLSDEAMDVTSKVKWSAYRKGVTIGGPLLDEICSAASSPGDISAPGLMVKFVK